MEQKSQNLFNLVESGMSESKAEGAEKVPVMKPTGKLRLHMRMVGRVL